MYQNDPMKVLTGECRLSYCNLTTPRAAQQGGEPKYSVTLLIPKTDVATKADIDAAIQAAANEALSKVWNGARPPQLRVPIYDGDGVRPSGVPFGDECKGHWVMTASTKNKPQVVRRIFRNAAWIFSTFPQFRRKRPGTQRRKLWQTVTRPSLWKMRAPCCQRFPISEPVRAKTGTLNRRSSGLWMTDRKGPSSSPPAISWRRRRDWARSSGIWFPASGWSL